MADFRYAQERDRPRYRRGDEEWSERGRGDRHAWRSDEGGAFGWGRDERRDADPRAIASRERNWQRRRQDERFHNYDSRREFPINETSRLIASNKVEGTPVYSRRGGDRLGNIYNFMVDKRSGRVEYAILAFGGFLGMGQNYFPLPWEMLTYDTREDGYVVDIDPRELDRAPSYRRGEEPRYDEEYGRYVSNYWGMTY